MRNHFPSACCCLVQALAGTAVAEGPFQAWLVPPGQGLSLG